MKPEYSKQIKLILWQDNWQLTREMSRLCWHEKKSGAIAKASRIYYLGTMNQFHGNPTAKDI